eukprot:2206335-Amphidinium_carterae.1
MKSHLSSSSSRAGVPSSHGRACQDSVRQEVDVPPQQPQVVGKASPAEGDVVSDDLKEIGDCPWGARAVIEARL